MPLDLGGFPGWALLMGAGFSKDWGGHLAADIWPLLASLPLVVKSDALREVFAKRMGHFEDALSDARMAVAAGKVSSADVKLLEKEIVEIFARQESTMLSNFECINASNVEDFLSFFGRGPMDLYGRSGSKFNTGYIFTLNQDLLVERLVTQRRAGFTPVSPGIGPFSSQRPLQRGPVDSEHRSLRDTRLVLPTSDLTLAGNLNYIKLHGSYEWRSGGGDNLMVVGGGKKNQIGKFPLLSQYLEVFKEVCSRKDLRLMIIGYGFGDDHINEILAKGARDNDLKIFLIDPRSPQDIDKMLLCERYHCDGIAKAIFGWSTKKLGEIFPGPSSGSRSVEYDRIRRDFFDGK